MFKIEIQVPFTGWEAYTCAPIDRQDICAWFRNLVQHILAFDKVRVYDGECLICECIHRKTWFNYSINATYINKGN